MSPEVWQANFIFTTIHRKVPIICCILQIRKLRPRRILSTDHSFLQLSKHALEPLDEKAQSLPSRAIEPHFRGQVSTSSTSTTVASPGCMTITPGGFKTKTKSGATAPPQNNCTGLCGLKHEAACVTAFSCTGSTSRFAWFIWHKEPEKSGFKGHCNQIG
jgi:hypothetical protein